MLNSIFQRAARPARARLFGVAAWAGALWAPAVFAAEPPAADQGASAPFKHYRSWRDEPLQDWRAVNERVGEVGGWRTYLREAQPAGDDADHNRQGHHGHHGH